MRMRSVRNVDITLKNCQFLIREEKEKYFSNDNPIHLEIGMGKGQFLLNMALKYPNINFIGVEKFDNVLAKAIEKISSYELDNLLVLREDALNLNEYFNNNIDTIYLNFSDPWPKKRHGERRLTSKTFLKRYDSLFKNDNKIIIKTDNIKLFESSLISLNNYGYTFEEISLDLHNSDIKNNVMTEYEVKFSNRRINYLKASKKSIKT